MTVSTAMPTVFITAFQGQDLSHAKMFGNVRPITTGRIESFKIDVLARQVNEALQDSRPEDWIIATGHMILGVMAAMEFARRHGRVNFLIWHAVQHKYLPRVLQFELGSDLSEPVLREMLAL